MINRLLDRIDTPRRHLAVLMGVLSITFVLTAALAWQAHVSQRENSDVKIVTSRNVASTGAKDIGARFAFFASGSVPVTHNQPALKAFLYQPDVSLLELAKLTTLDSLCPDCAGVSPRTYFAIDVKTGKIELLGDPVDVDLDQFLLRRVRSGPSGYALYNPIMAFGFYAVPLRKTPIALAYIRLDGDKPVRIYGAFIDSTTVHTLMHKSIAMLTLHPEAEARGLSTHDLIAVRMYADATRVFATGERGEEPTGHDLSIPPLFGARFEANVRDSAAETLFPRQNVAQWLVLGTLVTLIALLFGASLLLVRREAEVARMRADFVASASHELRTPLAQIRMFTETLLLGRVRSDTERRRSLEIVDQEARRLSNLVENLLAFSRNEGGRMVRLAPEPTHVADESPPRGGELRPDGAHEQHRSAGGAAGERRGRGRSQCAAPDSRQPDRQRAQVRTVGAARHGRARAVRRCRACMGRRRGPGHSDAGSGEGIRVVLSHAS